MLRVPLQEISVNNLQSIAQMRVEPPPTPPPEPEADDSSSSESGDDSVESDAFDDWLFSGATEASEVYDEAAVLMEETCRSHDDTCECAVCVAFAERYAMAKNDVTSEFLLTLL